MTHKYRLAELIVGFRGSENTSKTMFFTQIPLLVRLIEVFVVEKSIVDKHGDAMARHRTDIGTEWRHWTFPRRFAPLLCRVMSSYDYLLVFCESKKSENRLFVSP